MKVTSSNMDTVKEKQASYKAKRINSRQEIKHSPDKLTDKEKEDLILSLAGNVEWSGNLSVKRKSRTFS